MIKNLVVYVDRLKDGQTLVIEEKISSDFLDIHESELSFPSPVTIQGKTYLADDHLVVQLSLHTTFVMPCSICNENTASPVDIKNFYHVEPLEEIKGQIFDYTELLREAILLQIPAFIECNGGNCPERNSLNTFLKKKEKTPVSPKANPVHYPFADL